MSKINAGVMSSVTPEWYTPQPLITAIAAFLGTIDLDPCADSAHRVPALRHFTPPAHDGLHESWGASRVFMNPPYGSAIKFWVNKALAEPLTELIMLLPARTDTRWFQPIFVQCPAICFIAGRLHFVAGGPPRIAPARQMALGAASITAPFPSVLTYKGPRPDAFREHFARLGPIR